MTPTDLREELQHTLGDAYRIERELSPGGMSRLFLATERSLDRRVVIKLLPPEYASEVSAARFQREITVTAHLQHPHILPILSAGSKDGLLYYIMPYVDGESLRHRLAREGRLPVADAVRILREVADALARAHRAGIVHRDIKPENILLQDDHALLADFGVARALFQATGGERLTETGMGIGTPGYMAPEQLAGDRHVDSRADVYALAVVGYEMLAGTTPFAGATPQAVAAAHFTAPPKLLAHVRSEVPKSVSDAIGHALAKEPSERFASASDFRDALAAGDQTATRKRYGRRAAGALLGAIVVGAGFQMWRASHGTISKDANGAIRIAVLPFENIGDSADTYFADGITDEIRGKLSALPGLEVIASGSSNPYRRTTKSPQVIGRELSVPYLLVGRVRWDKHRGRDSRVRVEPELVQVAGVQSPTSRWQAPFDAPLTDVFAVQSDIATQVARRLQLTLSPSTRQVLAEQPTQNLDAYDAYLRGRELYARGDAAANLRPAAVAFREALARDSNFALAWASLAASYAWIYAGNPNPSLADSANFAAKRALSLAPDFPEALGAMARYDELVILDPAAEAKLDSAALARAPNNAVLLSEAGVAEAFLGRWDTALSHLTQAVQLSPRDAALLDWLADVQGYTRHPAAEAKLDSAALALEPTSPTYVEHEAFGVLAAEGLDSARAVLRAAPASLDRRALVAYVASNNDFGWMLDSAQSQLLLTLGPEWVDGDRAGWAYYLARQYAFLGNVAKSKAYADTARVLLQQQIRALRDRPFEHKALGLMLAFLGRKDEAIREGRRAVEMTKDAYFSPERKRGLAEIYAVVGEPEKAVAEIREMLQMPYFFNRLMFRVDPEFAPIRNDPGFRQLVGS